MEYPLVLWIVTLVILFVIEAFTHRPREGKISYEYTILLISLSFFAVIIASLLEYLSYGRENLLISLAGFGICLISYTIRVVSIKQLGSNFSEDIEIKKDHELITTGIYKYIRHPIYLATLLLLVGFPFILNAYYSVLLAIPGVVIIYWRLILEEKILRQRFGRDYKRYSKKTKKLVPAVF